MGIRGGSVLVPWRPAFWIAAEVVIAVKGLGEARQEQGGRAPPVQEAPAKGGGLHLASNSSRENAAAFAAR